MPRGGVVLCGPALHSGQRSCCAPRGGSWHVDWPVAKVLPVLSCQRLEETELRRTCAPREGSWQFAPPVTCLIGRVCSPRFIFQHNFSLMRLVQLLTVSHQQCSAASCSVLSLPFFVVCMSARLFMHQRMSSSRFRYHVISACVEHVFLFE